MKFRAYFLISIICCLAACATLPEKPPGPPIKPVPKPVAGLFRLSPDQTPRFIDDLDRESLEMAISRSLQYYDRIRDKRTFRFGTERYTVQEMKESLICFLEILRCADPDHIKEKKIRETFDFYQSSGRGNGRKVLFTGYFEPILEGSLERSERYQYPIYRTPDDMLAINLGKFKSKYRGERIVGRLVQREVVPYYNRKNIVTDGSLGDRGLEIAWLKDPVDIFFLHIQGSGTIRLPDGNTMQVGYADANGRPYRSIGRYLLERGKIAERDLSHRSIKRYLREHPEEMEEILNHNESFVFFRTVEAGPVGSLGVIVTEGRSIATDPEYFPRGALALIRLRKPLFDDRGEIRQWVSFTRFVLNQDTGGVIKGPGRVDIFCGPGEAAEQIAGSYKEEGDLFFLVKKRKLL